MIFRTLTIFILLLPAACSTGGLDAADIDNFTDEGFISDNIFQVIFKGRPDKNAKGLVEQRSTAYINAEYVLKNAALNKMAKYICGVEGETAATLPYLKNFEKYGYIWDSYYVEDNSAIIIFRFRKKDLKKDMEQIPCGGQNKKTTDKEQESSKPLIFS